MTQCLLLQLLRFYWILISKLKTNPPLKTIINNLFKTYLSIYLRKKTVANDAINHLQPFLVFNLQNNLTLRLQIF